MSLDPAAHKSWRGYIDLVRPPAGYQLAAAVGTTFGMSTEALVAALLAMIDSDADSPGIDALSGLMASTKLDSRVRVYVHSGSASAAFTGVPPSLVTLLDRIVVPVWPKRGLFHPKFWVARFSPLGARNGCADLIRLFVGSRNLAVSTSLELGSAFEGEPSASPSPLAQDASLALASLFRYKAPDCSAVAALAGFVSTIQFDLPHDARECRLRWQESSRTRMLNHLPRKIDRAVFLSPFLGGPLIQELLTRTTNLQVVSSEDAYRKLDQATFDLLIERGRTQKRCATYMVRDTEEAENLPEFSGLHAKVLLAEGKGFGSLTMSGSANGTEAGWGLSGAANVEAMIEVRPGIPIKDFTKSVVADASGKPRPWIDIFAPELRRPFSPEELLADRLRQFVCDIAGVEFRIGYDASRQRATVTLRNPGDARRAVRDPEIDVHIALAAVTEGRRWWEPMARLQTGSIKFEDVRLAEVSAFLLVRCTHKPTGACDSRSAFAHLELTEAERAERDAAARAELSASVSRDQLLSALIQGLPRARNMQRQPGNGGLTPGGGRRAVLGPVSLEEALRAIADRPDILKELRLLLGDGDPQLNAFQAEIEGALRDAQVIS